MEVNPRTVQNLVDYVEQTQPMVEELAALKKASAEAAPQTVETLVATGFLDVGKKAEAIESLQNPAKLHEITRKIAESTIQKQAGAPAPMGGPLPPAPLRSGTHYA